LWGGLKSKSLEIEGA